jgi:hypothetical protein
MRRVFIAVLTLFATPAAASAGEKMTGVQIEAALNDSTAWYLPLGPASARQYFNKNGETPYINAAGDKTYGGWLVRGDQYCSVWPPSDHYSCYGMEKGVSSDGTPTITFVSGGNGPRYEAVLKSGKHVDEVWTAQ